MASEHAGHDPVRYRSSMAFGGFPVEAIDFYERLAADNSRAFWHANKDTFERAVKTPMIEMCEHSTSTGRSGCSGRRTTCGSPGTARRTRRSRVPTPRSEGGTGYYVQVSAAGLMCGAGYYAMAKDQLERFREAVDNEHTGAEIAAVCAALDRARATASGRSRS